MFFNKCLNISNKGIQSEFTRGWDDRRRKCERIKEKVGLREIRYNFFIASDELKRADINKSIHT